MKSFNEFALNRDEIKVGDSVAYKAAFLRSIGAYTGNMPRARGVVKELRPLGDTFIAIVDWDFPDVPEDINIKNLVRVDRIPLEPV